MSTTGYDVFKYKLYKLMKFINTFFLLLLATNLFAQKIIPYNENIEEELWTWTRRTDTSIFELEGYEEIWKHVIVKDLATCKRVEPNAISADYGVFEFYDPGHFPMREYLMIKHHDSCTIVEYDFSAEAIVGQIEFLTDFFEEHKNIPSDYFMICLKHLVHVYEKREIILE